LVTVDGHKEIRPRKREKVTINQKLPRVETTANESKTADSASPKKKQPTNPPKAVKPPVAPPAGAPTAA
jgi:hypothetical protein